MVCVFVCIRFEKSPSHVGKCMRTIFGTHLSDKFAAALSMAIQPCVCYKLDG